MPRFVTVLSYLELAKIAYSKPDYRLAQSYYDSTVTNLGKDYPDYSEILSRRNSLTRLVKFMKVIETEDSLQSLSRLSPEEQIKKIDQIIADQEKAKKEAENKINEPSNQIFDPARPQAANQFNNAGGASWYFYNPQAISFGLNEFSKKFGNRKLEDNWRRSKKQSTVETNDDLLKVDSLVADKTDTIALTPANRKEEMLKSVPATQEALEKSTQKIIDAFYNIGMIYREQLNDLAASAGSFEELLKRYPKNRFQLQSYYQLYRTYTVLGNSEKANYYKNIILNEHSDSEYAEIIRNPNYAAEKANRKSNLEIFYEETYRKFLNGEYGDVIARKAQSDIQFPQNLLIPKFDFLKSLSIGKTQSLPVFEASLNEIIRNYSSDSVKDAAQEILDFIHNKPNITEKINEAAADSTFKSDIHLYNYLPDTMHNVVLLIQNINGPFDPNKIKNKLSNFNTANFASKEITFQELLYDYRLKIFIIKSFSNKQDAMQYLTTLYDNDAVFGSESNDTYQLYAISVNNLSTFLKEKKTVDYEDFFRKFYK